MRNQYKKLLGSILVPALLLMFSPFQSKALLFNDVVKSQGGKVLGDSNFASGSLVSEGGTIYFIRGTEKVPFASLSAFKGLGFSLENVVSGDLSNYGLSSYTIS